MTLRELQPSLPIDLRKGEVLPGHRASRADAAQTAQTATKRLRAIVDEHYDFLWRTLIYLGVANGHAEDAAQQVLCIVARRLGDIADGAERSFLFSTAMRVASEARRAARRRPAPSEFDVDALTANAPSPEQLVDERRAHEVLRQVLDAIPIDLRIVFILYEIEELTTAEAAALIGIPIGTASSRLRRAREHFQTIVRRMRAAQAHREREGRP